MAIKLIDLIVKGECSENDDFIEILIDGAVNQPIKMLNTIFESYENNSISMIVPALAAILSNSAKSFKQSIRSKLVYFLGILNISDVVFLVELLQSKIFKSGLGSFSQKIIKEVMQKWRDKELKEYVVKFPKDIYFLCKAVHPKFSPEKNAIIAEIFA